MAGPFSPEEHTPEHLFMELTANVSGAPDYIGRGGMGFDQAVLYAAFAYNNQKLSPGTPDKKREVTLYVEESETPPMLIGAAVYGASTTRMGTRSRRQGEGTVGHSNNFVIASETRYGKQFDRAGVKMLGVTLLHATAKDALEQGYDKGAYMVEDIIRDDFDRMAAELKIQPEYVDSTTKYAVPVADRLRMAREEAQTFLGPLVSNLEAVYPHLLTAKTV